ncbi:MAG: hypothetical protein KA004_05185 [Verrucomicrobiales bacterium]|nr:hypothetical protein [Verrucomicrobiales bacterium]
MNWKFWTWFIRQAAAKERRTFAGDGTWPFCVILDGDDAVLMPVRGRQMLATWFGGDNDPDDSGETASGVRTRGNPSIMGCALPMQISNGRQVSKCAGSPIVNIPWRTMVTVTAGGVTLKVPLIDVGPAKRTADSLDLTQAAFKKFAPLRQGEFKVDSVRIHGGAKYFN